MAKARAGLEDQMTLLSYIEAEMAPADAEGGCATSVPLFPPEGCMPSQAEAALVAALVADRMHGAELLDWQATVLEAAPLFDELGDKFNGMAAGWNGSAVPLKNIDKLLMPATDYLLNQCAEVIVRVCNCATPPLQELRDHMRLLRSGEMRKGKRVEFKGPKRDSRGNASPRRVLVLVPAVRLLLYSRTSSQGSCVRAWMGATRRINGMYGMEPPDLQAQLQRGAVVRCRVKRL